MPFFQSKGHGNWFHLIVLTDSGNSVKISVYSFVKNLFTIWKNDEKKVSFGYILWSRLQLKLSDSATELESPSPCHSIPRSTSCRCHSCVGHNFNLKNWSTVKTIQHTTKSKVKRVSQSQPQSTITVSSQSQSKSTFDFFFFLSISVMSVVGAAAKYSWPYGSINWYPGHMAKGARNITERLALVDTIIEVRDARVDICCSD